ncbi:MAG TPA: phosphodiesterase [Alphaproteobacteria bacterium]
MLIAQISDTHVCPEGERLYGRIDTNAGLARAIETVNRLRPRPDLVLMTGDLAESGEVAQYRMLRRLLSRLEMPVYVMGGNHDSREGLRAAFSDHGYLPDGGEFLHYAADLGPIRLIALDTQVPGADGGALCAERLAWLESELTRSQERPTLIAMHHPPVPIGVDWLDRSNCANAEGLAAIVARHPQVERILCGHVHRAVQIRFAGTVVATAPSTAYQVALELGHDGEPHLIEEPPGFLLHRWHGGALTSHVVPVGAFGAPQPYG